MPDTVPVALAEQLAGSPDPVSVREIADALGVAVVTVRTWAAAPTWPSSVRKRGKELLYRRGEVESWLDGHEAGRPDVGDLAADPDEMLTTRQIAERTGHPRSTVSSYPSLYGATSKDPFPPADALGRRRAGDVAAWFSRRRTRSGARTTAAMPGAKPRKAKRAPVARDVIDIHGIAEATGMSLEETKLLMRRQSLAAMRLEEKVGRFRVWPRKELLAELRSLDRAAAPSRRPDLTERRWLSGDPKSATELAEHYGVTVSAVMKRIERAKSSSDPDQRPPEPVDPTVRYKRYDPAAFDAFWQATSAASDRSRAWPANEMLAGLRRRDRVAASSLEAEPADPEWLTGGPRTATEFAEHYGVTISAVMKRIERAKSSGDPEHQPPEPIDAGVRVKRYDPAAFDRFWRGGNSTG